MIDSIIMIEENGIRSERRGVISSLWWKRIVTIAEEPGGRWFMDNMERIIGNGEDINFWTGTALKNQTVYL